MVSWLLRDFSFQARVHVCRVLKLCVLITGRPRVSYPSVTFDLRESKLSEKVSKVFASGAELCFEPRICTQVLFY